jgi:hypothetical protein
MLCQCPRVLFPFWSSIVEEVLLAMVKKTVDQHVLSNFASTTVVSTSFDLWTSHNNVDIFALVTNFLNDNWVPMHVISSYLK